MILPTSVVLKVTRKLRSLLLTCSFVMKKFVFITDINNNPGHGPNEVEIGSRPSSVGKVCTSTSRSSPTKTVKKKSEGQKQSK